MPEHKALVDDRGVMRERPTLDAVPFQHPSSLAAAATAARVVHKAVTTAAVGGDGLSRELAGRETLALAPARHP